MAELIHPRSLRRAGVVTLGLAVALVVGFPIFELVREAAGTGSAVGDIVGSSRFTEPIINTLWTGLAVTALVLVVATGAAVVTERVVRRGRGWMRALMLIPLLTPPFVSAISWLAAYGPGGVTDDALGISSHWLEGPAGVVAVIAVNAMPLAYLVLAAALATTGSHDRERAARVAGAGPWVAFRTVLLPALRPALVAAGALVFVFSVNSFGVPAVLGTPSGFATATTRLYQDLAFSADPTSFSRVLVLAAFLVAISLVVVGAADAAGSRGRILRLRPEPVGPRRSSPRMALPIAVVAGYGILVGVLPLVALVLRALTRGVGLAAVPANWTLDNFSEALDAGAGAALGRSLLLAAGAALVVVVLASLTVAVERRRVLGFGTAATLTFAVPGSALAVAVLLAYGPWLRDTLLLILIAYVAKFWALGHRPLAGAADGVSPEVFGAARVSGAGPTTAVRTVVVPLLGPALVAAGLLVFLFGVHELTMSSLLYGPGSETLAVVILNLRQLGDATVTAAFAVLLMAVVVAAAVPLLLVARRRAL